MGTRGGRLNAAVIGLSIGVIAWVVVGVMIFLDAADDPVPTAVADVLPTVPPVTVKEPAISTAQTAVAIVLTDKPTATASLTLTLTPVATETAQSSPTASPSPTQPHAITATPLILPTSADDAAMTAPDSAASASTNTPTVVLDSSTSSDAAANAATSACPPPDGWVAYAVEEGDTLFGFQLGAENAVSVEEIMQANCLSSKMLSIGQVLFLPAGVAENSPKTDGGGLVLPAGASRVANCPCTIQVRQGWRLEQIAVRIDETPVSFSGRDFLAVVSANASVPAEFSFLASRPAGASLEGFMLPGEYTLTNETSAYDLRDMMLRAFGSAVTPDLQTAMAVQGLSLWEGINMASIIQRESYDAEAQKIIASIFYNRRARGMGLGSFTTLQYALGGAGSWWPRITKSNINTDTPYATHRYKGLPPTPISNPGLTAIFAVAYPAQTDYLYMNAKCGGGGNYYARTYEEFQQGLQCE